MRCGNTAPTEAGAIEARIVEVQGYAAKQANLAIECREQGDLNRACGVQRSAARHYARARWLMGLLSRLDAKRS